MKLPFLLLLLLAGRLGAQDHVLDLDGRDSYLELPAGMLEGLQEATVEAWVRWDSACLLYTSRCV